jgi:peptide chain release factor 3
MTEDLDGDPVFLARNQFDLEYTAERAPSVAFKDVKDARPVGVTAGRDRV